MLEVSPGGLGALVMSATPLADREKLEVDLLRERAHKLCRDYLRGAWLNVQAHEMTLTKVSGGLSNLLYYCALPESQSSLSGEPTRLLLRLYGNVNADRTETLVESVIFTLLSETQRGPRLYGVFPGGRLEEYIQARPLLTRELADPRLNSLIAEKIAQIHLMDVPISKQPTWLWDTLDRWMLKIEETMAMENLPEKPRKMLNKVQELELKKEAIWLKSFLTRVKSPVVFCHNDLQEGNILLKDPSLTQPNSYHPIDTTNKNPLSLSSLVVIDYEYCSYNYRGFDLANHFCEWVFDYSNQDPPYFWALEKNTPSTQQKEHFVTHYLAALKRSSNYRHRPHDTLESVLKEVEAFTLASHFFWSLWSIINFSTEITFDYWGYGEMRLQLYYKHKTKLLQEFGPE